MGDARSSRRAGLGTWLLLVALVFATYWPTLAGDFLIWDDLETIGLNRALNPPTLSSVAQFWDPRRPQMDLYIPVTYALWSAVAAGARVDAPDAMGLTLNPLLFHLANVLLHAGSAMVMFQILRKLLDQDWPALAAAAVFAVHPVQVEAVGWISGGKDVLSGLLGLIAVWQYLIFAKERALREEITIAAKPKAAAGEGARGSSGAVRYAIATVAFVLAMLAKPAVVTVPLIAAVIDWMILRRPLRQVMVWILPWLILAIPVVWIGRHAQPAALVTPPPWFDRPVIAADAIGYYLVKLVAPVRLAIDYGRSPQWVLHNPGQLAPYLAVSVLAVLIVLLLWLRWKLRWPACALAVFILALLPVLGFVPFDYQRYSTVADHYLYVAMLGMAMLVAWIVALAARRWGAAAVAVIAGLVIIGLAARSFAQGFVWRDTASLFRHAVSVNPNSLAANLQLGAIAAAQGNDPAAERYYRSALSRNPDDPVANFNYANVLVRLGHPDDAIPHYKSAVQRKPDDPQWLEAYARALQQTGREVEASKQLDRARRIRESSPIRAK